MQQQKLLSLIRQAIEDYNMIEEGDKIAVGVSGGKDSLALLHAMKILNRFYPKKFELYAITCNVGFEGMDFTGVRKFCESINVPYEQVDTEIAKIVFEDNKDERPCSLCAKLRKGAMYKRLGELGINKIAYAHNKDDFIETALMSLIYEGRFYAFPPVTYLPEAGVTVIRPMMYAPEKGVANFVINQGIKVKARKKYEAFVIDAGDVTTEHRGKLNWQRDVNDIITSKYEGKVDRIVLGETYSMPGQWSSYPSHKHDTDNLPFEVNMEEIYHFKVNPGQGFGIQVMYSDDMSLRESYIIKNGDSVAIKNGYHPVAAAPGYQVYYLWVMAGVDTRQLTPCDDPDHAWVKAVEKMV